MLILLCWDIQGSARCGKSTIQSKEQRLVLETLRKAQGTLPTITSRASPLSNPSCPGGTSCICPSPANYSVNSPAFVLREVPLMILTSTSPSHPSRVHPSPSTRSTSKSHFDFRCSNVLDMQWRTLQPTILRVEGRRIDYRMDVITRPKMPKELGVCFCHCLGLSCHSKIRRSESRILRYPSVSYSP